MTLRSRELAATASLSEAIGVMEEDSDLTGKINSLALRFLTEANKARDKRGDYVKATELLLTWLEKNPGEDAQLLPLFRKHTCEYFIALNQRNQRKLEWDENSLSVGRSEAPTSAGGKNDAPGRRKHRIYLDPYDWPLTPYIRLGDATEAECREVAQRYGMVASDEMAKHWFYKSIADNLRGTNKTVREGISRKTLMELKAKAKTRAAKVLPMAKGGEKKKK